MKHTIENEIAAFVNAYPRLHATSTSWRTPLVAYADAEDPMFLQLKDVINPGHAAPKELMKAACTVVVYFLPFAKEIPRSNRGGDVASRNWALAYIDTNRLIVDLNDHLASVLKELGIASFLLPPTHNFDTTNFVSDWSHKHVGYIAGLGTFGIHRMLITDEGCCGRLGSIITDAPLSPTARRQEEHCLYCYNKSCTKCLEKCTFGALALDHFDAHTCYEILLKNAERYEHEGYADACGKCVSVVPCSFVNPVAKAKLREK
jgi:epoxyqueuosine reductase QueG